MACLRFLTALSLAVALGGTGALYAGNSGNSTSPYTESVSSRGFYDVYDDPDSLLPARQPDSTDFGNSSSTLMSRDVWSPKIISPTAKSVWVAGTTTTVTWDTRNQPADITNTEGKIFLGHVEDGTDEHLDVDHPLAQGFDLREGKVQVEVPNVTPGNDYIVVLMGDSGNKSPTFTIN
ncbi:uncharacterized protein PHACADRAFT_262590 [Phanerochaete carnosa HHB-10118-sp]|uniref:Yeast cell wall synthesis Kre9/Knh1-like N-terminal domain-containing protein n=1 Tax=Phanerochaete carnosa (strain HHB-10118-sp) TaxID=650164 RepID=K5WP48_PHACS|nr:uncharacterized protein PHACADRAFT_262590 [Phanerochaete carnosa HHB-10118-sp]EKM52112.1 hypothetical protein PHACADRAFT_262590 [Phanerochaete carnosa HHB-10118-sp]